MNDPLILISAIIATVSVGGIAGTLFRFSQGRISDRTYLVVFSVFALIGVVAFVAGPFWAWRVVAVCGVGFFAGTALALPSNR